MTQRQNVARDAGTSSSPARDRSGDQIQTARVNDITIAYRIFGSGPPLVLINGFASTMDTWNPPVLHALSRKNQIVIFDHRGTGYSLAGAEEFSVRLFANDTAGLMEALEIPHAHILGLSMGASVAQELVLTRPAIVDRLILVAGTCGGDRMIRMSDVIWNTLADKSGTMQDIADRMFSVLFPRPWLATHDPWQYCPDVHETTSVANAARQSEAFFSWPGSCDRLPEIRCPVLVMTGSEDVVIPPENSALLAGCIPGARLVTIPGAGHGMQYQCPKTFVTPIRSFLDWPTG